MTLATFFAAHPRAALAFSGGTDSTYLLYAARQYGAELRPYFLHTAFQGTAERQAARELCALCGTELTVVELDILAIPEVAQNPADRCYFCKRALFSTLLDRARADGCTLLLDGTNASDEAGDRPGMRALRELQVLSPLRDCGLTKADIRRLSREAGLPTWDQPGLACLATRIPTGTPITEAALRRAEAAESLLRKSGYSDLRVRVWGDTARLQLPASQLSRAAAEHESIRQALAPYFTEVLLDLRPRSGM